MIYEAPPSPYGTRYPKNVDQSLTFGVWVPFSTHYTLDSDGISFKVYKEKSLILVLPLVALHAEMTNVGGILFADLLVDFLSFLPLWVVM